MATQVITQKDPEIMQDVETIQIPDLWHVAMSILDGRDFSSNSKEYNAVLSNAILEVWYLTHNLRQHIIDNQ